MEFPTTLDADEIQIDVMPNGEWELTVKLADGTELYHYIDLPDSLYEQLVEGGLVEVPA